jgi:hypothetical protein
MLPPHGLGGSWDSDSDTALDSIHVLEIGSFLEISREKTCLWPPRSFIFHPLVAIDEIAPGTTMPYDLDIKRLPHKSPTVSRHTHTQVERSMPELDGLRYLDHHLVLLHCPAGHNSTAYGDSERRCVAAWNVLDEYSERKGFGCSD